MGIDDAILKACALGQGTRPTPRERRRGMALAPSARYVFEVVQSQDPTPPEPQAPTPLPPTPQNPHGVPPPIDDPRGPVDPAPVREPPRTSPPVVARR